MNVRSARISTRTPWRANDAARQDGSLRAEPPIHASQAPSRERSRIGVSEVRILACHGFSDASGLNRPATEVQNFRGRSLRNLMMLYNSSRTGLGVATIARVLIIRPFAARVEAAWKKRKLNACNRRMCCHHHCSICRGGMLKGRQGRSRAAGN